MKKTIPLWLRNSALVHFINQEKQLHSFEHHYIHLLFKRLWFTSLFLIFTYPFYIAVDWFFLSSAQPHNKLFFLFLAVIHFVPAFLSGLFLVLYKKCPPDMQAQMRYGRFWISFYVFTYLSAGAAASLNSQFLTENIYAYLIICAAVAVLFPAGPKRLGFSFGLVHIVFLSGLFWIGGTETPVIMDAINSTGAVLIACIVSFIFFSYQKKEFASQQQLKENEETFRRLFNVNPHPLLLVRLADEELLLFNQQAARYVEDGHVVSFLFQHPKEKNMILENLHASGIREQHTVFRQLPSGESAWITMSFELVDFQKEIALLICMTDVTEFKQTENQLYKRASVDELTGLLNRRFGLELLSELVLAGASFTVCYIDLNNLKAVNDLHGHKAGDAYIQQCCQAVQSQLRAEDVFFRMGGDEFIIVFPDQSPKQAAAVWEKVEEQLDQLNEMRQFPYVFSASCGFVHSGSHASPSVEELLEAADREMYQSKLKYKQQKDKIT